MAEDQISALFHELDMYGESVINWRDFVTPVERFLHEHINLSGGKQRIAELHKEEVDKLKSLVAQGQWGEVARYLSELMRIYEVTIHSDLCIHGQEMADVPVRQRTHTALSHPRAHARTGRQP